MQDYTLVKTEFRSSKNEHVFAVFDGHGGVECVRFVWANFASTFEDMLRVFKVPVCKASDLTKKETSVCLSKEHAEAVEKALMKTFEILHSWCKEYFIPHGTCAVVTYIYKDVLFTACAGDSQSISYTRLSTKESEKKPDETDASKIQLEMLSHLIRPSDPEELARIEKSGGFVNNRGRINGKINCSRALGDVKDHPFVTWIPVIKKSKLSVGRSVLLVASDGIWHVLTPEQAGEIVYNEDDPSIGAQKLLKEACKMGSKDNISVICVNFT